MTRKLIAVLTSTVMALLASCSPIGVLNGFVPTAGYKTISDISYGPGAKQKLDIHIPDHADGRNPVVIFFYGGRWTTGKKEDYLFAAQAFTSQGFVTVIADMRLYPEVRFPVFLEDAARAVVWTRDNIARYGGNRDALFIAGHSSGAYTAVMLAMDARYLEQANGKPSDLRGAIGLAGPYDFLPFTDKDVIDIFSTAQTPQETQPITFATGKRPPVLLLHGEADETVRLKNTVNLAAQLRAHGSAAETKTYPGIGHIGIILSLSNTFRGRTTALRDATDFIRRHAAAADISATGNSIKNTVP